ncbi:hypothetical protein C8F04DRAFT_1359852 [Mycena alexandri]|uniref:Uncharacterized protein n=1 Tax=Mycena alexandri TaxID=1745969 RepID=A0AAD6RVC8_9AGAR|nr:hypothetical protein C8F04DRAFT_1359852 [Mycena alexandri]
MLLKSRIQAFDESSFYLLVSCIDSADLSKSNLNCDFQIQLQSNTDSVQPALQLHCESSHSFNFVPFYSPPSLSVLVFRAAMQSQPNSTSNSDSNLFPSEHRVQTAQVNCNVDSIPFPTVWKSKYPGGILSHPSSPPSPGTFVLSNVNLFKNMYGHGGEIAERDGSVRRARVDAEDCAGRNESARGRSHARVTRAAFGTRGLDADGVRTRQRHPPVHRASPRPGAGPASEPAAALARIPRARRASKLGCAPHHNSQPTPRAFHTLDVCGDGAHTHTHGHSIRGECERRTPEAAVYARPRTGMNAGFPRSEPAAARMCTQGTPLHACDRARLSRCRRTGVGKATGKRDGMGLGLDYGGVGQIEKEGAHLGMRHELVAPEIAGGGGGAELTHLALPTWAAIVSTRRNLPAIILINPGHPDHTPYQPISNRGFSQINPRAGYQTQPSPTGFNQLQPQKHFLESGKQPEPQQPEGYS